MGSHIYESTLEEAIFQNDYHIIHVLRNNISSTESFVTIHIIKTWAAFDWLSTIWKTEQSYEIKHGFFQAVTNSVLMCVFELGL